MSRGVFLATWLATGAVAFAATQVALTLTLPRPTFDPVAQLSRLGDLTGDIATQPQAYVWPALFGVPAVVEAPEPVAAPVVSTTYRLKGLIAGLDDGWAIITDGTRELMVRLGDTLADGSVVARIDRHGVILDLDGQMVTVSFAETDAPAPGAAATETAGPSEPQIAVATRVELDISDLNTTDIRRMMGRAGAVSLVELPDGTKALDVLWIRAGQLYAKLGLEPGDRILTINTIAAGDNEALMQSMGDLLSSDEYNLNIIRNGARQAITVSLLGHD